MSSKRLYWLPVLAILVGLLFGSSIAQARPRDHSGPAITISSPTATTYDQGQSVTASYSCSDPSGVATCSGPVSSGSTINTNTAGQFTFTVQASDRLGNRSSKSVVYTVQSPPPPPIICQGYVALTFDDGPTGTTQQYINALKAGGAHATFFDIGQNVNTTWGAPLTRATVNAGNDIGDHTMTHPDLTQMTDSQVTAEIKGQKDAVFNATGGYVETMFRPPYLAENQTIFDIAQSLGLTQISDTYDTEDWADPPTSTTVSNVLANAHDQAIILMHDGHTNTLAAIPQILDGLRQMGLCPGKMVRDTSSTLTDPWEGGFPMYVRVQSF